MYAKRLMAYGDDTGMMGWVAYDDQQQLYLVLEDVDDETCIGMYRLHAIKPSENVLELEAIDQPPSKKQLRDIDCTLTDVVCDLINGWAWYTLAPATLTTSTQAYDDALEFLVNHISRPLAYKPSKVGRDIEQRVKPYVTPKCYAWIHNV